MFPADTLVPIPDHVSDSEGAALQALTDAVAGVAAAEPSHGQRLCRGGSGRDGSRLDAGRTRFRRGNRDWDRRSRCRAQASRGTRRRRRHRRPCERPARKVLELTGGRGADVVIDAAGGPPEQGLAGSRTLELAAQMVRDNGVVVGTALLGEGTFLAYHLFRHRAIRYVFPAILTRGLLRHVVNLVASRRILVEPTISAVLRELKVSPRLFS